MNSYDFIEIFTILQGLKRNLLNKEELLQITRIEDMEELYKRLKAMFNLNREINSKADVEEFFDYVREDYLSKIEPFLKINMPGLSFRDLLLYKVPLGGSDEVAVKFKKIHIAMGHLAEVKWSGESIFRQWFDILLVLFLYRVRTAYQVQDVVFRKHDLEFLDLDTREVFKMIFESETPEFPRGQLADYDHIFDLGDLQEMFEAAKVVFYSYLLKMENSMDMDNVLSRILAEIFLFVRQSELILASINCLELGINRQRLTNTII